ncbi:MAG: SIS domain-containing protein [Kiritimatiellae bacterium]|nr:SIS domain-containing protein [Kiritimatiellia bacterium]
MISKIKNSIRDSASAIEEVLGHADKIVAINGMIIDALVAGNKILTAGNGGSAAESLHMAEELVGRFRTNRVSLPAVSLVADSTALTCIGNDFGFEYIFSRQIEGLGKSGDILVLFSSSGSAENLKQALLMAHSKGLKVICLLGKDGGQLAGMGDLELIAPGGVTERIQEVHQLLLHIILDAVEEKFSD